MRRTKIVCTMGPNTNSRDLMKKLIETGMDVARFNFSHGDHDEQKMRMDMLKELRKELKTPVAILLDTKGPEIRTGVLKDGKKVNLVTGQTFTLTTVQETGDENHCSVSYTGLTEDIKEGDTILIDDGLIGLRVEKSKCTGNCLYRSKRRRARRKKGRECTERFDQSSEPDGERQRRSSFWY